MTTITIKAALHDAGWLEGAEGEVSVDLDDLWELIDTKALMGEVADRVGEKEVEDFLSEHAVECNCDDDWDDRDAEPFIERMSAWDREALIKAINEDDGRRAIDLLKEALSCSAD